MARNFGVPRQIDHHERTPVWPTWLVFLRSSLALSTRRSSLTTGNAPDGFRGRAHETIPAVCGDARTEHVLAIKATIRPRLSHSKKRQTKQSKAREEGPL